MPHSNILQSILTPNNLNSNRSNRSFRASSTLGHSTRPTSSTIDNYEKYEPYVRGSKTNGHLNSKHYDEKLDSKSTIDSLGLSLRKPRPSSAPIGIRPPLYNNAKSSKSNYRRQPNMIRALCFRNGTRQYSANIAAKNLIEVNIKIDF